MNKILALCHLWLVICNSELHYFFHPVSKASQYELYSDVHDGRRAYHVGFLLYSFGHPWCQFWTGIVWIIKCFNACEYVLIYQQRDLYMLFCPVQRTGICTSIPFNTCVTPSLPFEDPFSPFTLPFCASSLGPSPRVGYERCWYARMWARQGQKVLGPWAGRSSRVAMHEDPPLTRRWLVLGVK